MNTEQAIEYTIKALKSKESGMPDDLAELKDELIKTLMDRRYLDQKHRKSMALALFSYSMHIGPATFVDTADAVLLLGVEVEFDEYTAHFRGHVLFDKVKEMLYGK